MRNASGRQRKMEGKRETKALDLQRNPKFEQKSEKLL
jgi:hypothetical protein